MSKPYKEIAPISPENREAIRRKTAYSLPDEPSARGMPPDQIRKHFWSALTGDRQSLFVEIDRVAKETNAAIDALLILIFGTVEVDGEAVRIAELIPTGISDYSLADLLAGFVDGSAQQLISSGVGGMSMAEYLALLDQKIEEGGGGGGIAEETDPTVPAWAKQPSKPTYTAPEVGARPDTWMPTYTNVGADKSGAAASAVSEHNTNTAAHNDIRLLVQGLAARLNAFANSTDEDLDTAQEFMLYIKANRDLISQITTSKVSVADIVNNLTTNVTNKPLSAAQGVALKALIDALDTGTAEADSVPDYWIDELDAKADAIQAAMEKAGRNKSAFLWYTDAHWVNGNSKVSPKLLNYLYMHTPMNKVNFGGDIIGDTLLATREEMKYLYEWRKAIKDLPNHHSVFGNHDMFNLDSVDYEDDNYRYAFLLAPEESYDQVWGGGNYYYIDNPAEKTRYLYICYPNTDTTWLLTQTQFIADSLKSTHEGWHIVAIAHRWWQYSSSSTPTVGSVGAFEADILSVFDAYNARATRNGSNYFYAQDFTDAKGKVEFCIGGHIHVDYDFESAGGIPIIITTSDTNQNRVPDSTVDSGTVGTTTEAAVYGIIADYNDATNPKIIVVGVGRGTSRVVRSSGVKATSISNITYSGDTTVGAIIDKSKFSFTVNYSNGATDTITGATSVSPATIGVVGDNSVTITYTEGTATLNGTITIVGTPVPVVNLLSLDRTYVVGTTGESMGTSHLDESKACQNVAYSNLTFNAKACTVADVSDDGVTITEPGVGGICVAYPVHLSDIDTQDYKLSFDYTGNGSTRVYYKYGKADGTFSANQTALNASGSSHADLTIPSANTAIGTGFEWLIIIIGANTGKTTTLSNVSLTKA